MISARAALPLCVMLQAARAAAAEPCAKPGEPYVVVARPPVDLERELGVALVAQLRAGLSARGVAVCALKEAPAHAPIARVGLESGPGTSVVITVAVADQLTDKRLARDVDLSNAPRDTWPLVLALAMDEALRASWAELALKDAPPPKQPVPSAVKRAVSSSLSEERLESAPLRVFVGAAIVAETYAAGQQQLGVDARGELRFASRLFLHALAGLRGARDVESVNGTIRSRALVVGAGPGLTLSDPLATFGVDFVLRGELTRVSFDGDGAPGARADSGSATAIYAEGGLAGWIAPAASLRAVLEVTAGAPLRAATAIDQGEVATGLDGGSLSLALAFGGVF